MLEVLVDQHRCDDQDDEVLEQQQGKRSNGRRCLISMFMIIIFSIFSVLFSF